MAEANAPPERDVKDFKFQQLCKVRVTDTPSALPKNRASLVVASSKYGLTFVAVQKGFKVLRTSDFIIFDHKHALDRLKHIITDFPVLADVNVGYVVTNILLSADELTLAVAITRPEHTVVYLYDVRNFAAQVTGTVAAFHMIVGEGSKPVNDLSWNPVDPNLLIICYCTGRLDIYNGQVRKASLSSARAKCVCWSPKGKQLVVGRDDGTLVQYDPDLNEKRKWGSPNILTAPSEALDLVWLSTYSFLVAYVSQGADCSEQPSVILVNGSKDGPVTYDCFEDVCFGSGEDRERKYYFSFLQKWDMILAGSSNGAEIGIVGKHLDNKQVWERWNLDDSSRAECPLTDEYVDTFPMGLTLDFSSQYPIPLGEDKTHPASPLLLILSTEGLLIPYYMMYMHPSAPALTAPVQTLDVTGLRKASGVPANPASQPGVVKNLFGPTPSLAGSAKFPITSGIGVPASSLKSDQSETKQPLSAGFGTTSFAGSTDKLGAGAGFSATPTFGAPATADGSFSFQAGTSGTGAFPAKTMVAADAVPTGKPTTSGQALNLTTKAPDGSSQSTGFGFPAKGTDAASSFSFKPTTAGKTPTPVFGQTSQPASLFGQSAQKVTPGTTQSQAPAPVLGQTAQKTAAVTMATATVLPAFGKATTAATAGATGLDSTSAGVNKPIPAAGKPIPAAGKPVPAAGKPVPAAGKPVPAAGKPVPAAGKPIPAAGKPVPAADKPIPAAGKPIPAAGKPVPNFTGQSSAFSGMTSAAVGKPLHTSDSQTSDFAQSGGNYVPKSPTGPPPSVYPGSGARAQSPKFAPPPQYPSDAQDGRDQQGSRETTDAVDQQFSKSILDEIEHFSQELSEFRYKAMQTNYAVGTKNDMKQLKLQTQEMDKFCTDIKATVQEQNKEVQDGRALCLDMFSMVEECRMRQHMNTDPKYLHLQKSRALDPGSAEKLQQLQLQYQVLDQGLRDVDLILDTQWEEYQNRKKNRTNRVQNPTNDAVYRVVKSNHNLILAQKSKLKELEERLKQLKLYNKTSAWNNTSGFRSNDTTTELSNLADTLLSVSPVKSKSDSFVREERTVSRNRLERLREHLCRRNVSIIHSTKPGNLSKLKIPDRQLELSMFRNSPQQLAGLKNAQRNAGEFVGMFRRTSPTPNYEGSRESQAGTPQTDRQTVRAQNEKNKQEQGKEKTDKDGKMKILFKKIIEKGEEKVGTIFSSKSQAKPPVATSQGLGIRPPAPVATSQGLGTRPPAPVATSQSLSIRLPVSVATSQGLRTRPPVQQVAIPKTVQTAVQAVKEINGIKFEDITPSGSENDIDDTEEDDEYDQDSSGSNGVEGFGIEYNMPPVTQIGNAVDLTPVAIKTGSKPSIQDSTRFPSSAATSTPVGRKLFTAEETKPAASFNFGAGVSGSSSIKFGADASTADVKTKPASVSKPFTFMPSVTPSATFGSQSEATKPPTGFNFSMAGTPSFGVQSETQSGSNKDDKKPEKCSDEGKPAVGQITGLFGKGKPPSAESETSEPKSGTPVTFSSKPNISFGQSSATTTSSNLFGQAKTTPAPASSNFGHPISTQAASQGIFGQPTHSETSVIGQPSDAVTSSVETTNDSGETTPQGDSSISSGNFHGKVTTSETEDTGLFGQSSTATASSVGNFFGKPSFGTTTTTNVETTVTSAEVLVQKADSTSASGFFGQASTSSVGSGLFGKPVGASTSVATTSSSSLFGQTTTASGTGLFGQATTTTSGASLFGQAATTSSGTGLFGQTATTISGTGLFGQTTTTTSGTGLFGQTPTTTSGTSLFGQTTTTTSGTGLFGQTTTTTSGTGLFGQTTTTTSGTGLFGQTPTTATPETSLFGQPTSATSSAGTDGLFGQKASTTTAAGFFGQSATSTSSGGLFGETPSSGSSFTSPFGQSATSSSGGMFGQPGGSLFGQTTTGGSSGLFGTPTSSTSGGLFGQPATTTSGGLFGQTSTSGGAGLFGQTSTGSGFGTATSGSGFGFGQSASPGFGKPAFGQSPGFGQTQSSGSPFGQSSSESGGGGLFGGLGGKPSAEKANTNVFGTAQPFGTSQSNTQNLFGSGTNQSFGSGASTGGGFSSGGTFSTGTGVAATGFGAAKQPTGTGGFGPAPAFGSGPSFGGTPAFGSTPGFGSPPAFGGGSSPGAFGTAPAFGSPAGATFGSVGQGGESGGFAGFAGGGSPTFGALAHSNDAPTFGGMGQSPNAGGFGGNTGNSFGANPAFTGYRG